MDAPRTLEEWLAWQARLHGAEIALGLERVREVAGRLGCTQSKARVITIAGTNGKGSSAAMLEAILSAAGYRTGCYTSPHLLRYNERIRLRGDEATDDAICEAFARVEAARRATPLTYFEFGTLAALDLFQRSALDVLILEVGLGGRLDAVNIVDPDVALVTTVDLDHAAWLGSTRESVAREKAGIMRRGRPAVFGGQDPPRTLLEEAARIGARLHLAGRDFGFTRDGEQWQWQCGSNRRHGLPLPSLRGGHQLRNAAACLMVLELLSGVLPVDQQAVRTGLRGATLAGRFQVVGRDPCVVLDVAHNPEAAAALARNLESMFCAGRTRAVFGVLADKETAGVVAPIRPLVDEWYLGGLETPRALSVEETAARLAELGVERDAIALKGTVREALRAACGASAPEDRVLVFGSFFTVAGALAALEEGRG